MRIHADYNRASCRPNSKVQARGRGTFLILEDPYVWLVPAVFLDDLACTVVTHTVNHQNFQPIPGIVVGENRVQAAPNEKRLVPAW